MGDQPAGTPDPTIVEVRHSPGGIVALLSSGELVRLFRAGPAQSMTIHDNELIGLSVARAKELARERGVAVHEGYGESDAAPG
jgi:hypothetical protein